jgi:hypothetical protein
MKFKNVEQNECKDPHLYGEGKLKKTKINQNIKHEEVYGRSLDKAEDSESNRNIKIYKIEQKSFLQKMLHRIINLFTNKISQ